VHSKEVRAQRLQTLLEGQFSADVGEEPSDANERQIEGEKNLN
jgi:hypothetical protein